MKYLVCGCKGPSFMSDEEMARVLEEIVLPSFEQLMKLEKEKKIVAGGLPVGERAFVFVVEAASNEELDRMLRKLPMWPMMEWEVTALEPISDRAAQERSILKEHLAGAHK
jgi:muconolactone delta-isomerase